MSELPPDLQDETPMETAWRRSGEYEFDGRKLNYSRTRHILVERLGLNADRAAADGSLQIGEVDGQQTIHYDGMLEDVCLLLYVASLDDAGVRKARRHPDIAKDNACNIFDDWDIPMSGPRYNQAVSVAMEMLTDIRNSHSVGETTNDSKQERNTDESGK